MFPLLKYNLNTIYFAGYRWKHCGALQGVPREPVEIYKVYNTVKNKLKIHIGPQINSFRVNNDSITTE